MLNSEDRRQFLEVLRRPGMVGMARRGVRKKIQEKAKKNGVCPHCKAANGTVKKCGMLKILHEKYKVGKKKVSDEVVAFHQSFASALEYNKDLGPLMGRAQEALNPLKVLALFKAIPEEVRN